MPPIPTFNNAPLHPQGVTPQTAVPDENAQYTAPTRTTDAPTTTATTSNPPAPQPGTRPIPPTAGQAQPTSHYAAPPQPGPRYQPTVTATHTTTETYLGGPVAPPAQFYVPPPGQNYAATHSTHPADKRQSFSGPVLPLPTFAQSPAQPSPYESGASRSNSVSEPSYRHSLEHPPGYVQNPYAADGTADDRARRASIAIQERQEQGALGSVKSVFSGFGQGLKKAEEGAWKYFSGGR